MKNGKVAFNPGQLNPNIVRPAGPSDPDGGILLGRDLPKVGPRSTASPILSSLQETSLHPFGKRFRSPLGAGTSGDLNRITVDKKEPVKGPEVAERLGT